MKTAFVYAGQGSQRVGMGKDFQEAEPLFAQTLEQAAQLVRAETDFDLKKCCFEGPREMLDDTRYTQPCMCAFAVGVTRLLQKAGFHADYTLGLSLGEYSALYAAGVLTMEQLFPLIAYRGKVMAEAVTERAVKMVAVLKAGAGKPAGQGEQIITEACRRAGVQTGLVAEVANYNSPDQTVISGDATAIDLACTFLREAGVRTMIPLAVSGPFHTSLMKPAGDRLRERLRQIAFGSPHAVVVHNLTAAPIRSGESYADLLEQQVQRCVRLEESIHYLASQGVTQVIEIGPGDTLAKLIRKTEPSLTVSSISTWADYRTLINAAQGAEEGEPDGTEHR